MLQWGFEIVAEQDVVVFPAHAEGRIVTGADIDAATPILRTFKIPLQ